MRRCIAMGILLCAGFLVGNSAYGQEGNLPPEATIDCPERLIFLLDEQFPGENRGTAPGDCRLYKYGYSPFSRLNRYGNTPGNPSCGPVLGPSFVNGQSVLVYPRQGVCDEFNTADSGGSCPGVLPDTSQATDPKDRSVLEASGRSNAGPFIIDPAVVTSSEGAAFRSVDCGAITPKGVDPAECGAGQLATVFDDNPPGQCTGGSTCRVDGDCPGGETCGAPFTIGFGFKFNQNGNGGATRCVAGGNLCSGDGDCAGADVCELGSGDTLCCQSVVPDFCPNVVGFGDYPDVNRPVNLPVVDRLQQAPNIHDGGRGSAFEISQSFVLTNDLGQQVQLHGRCSAGGCQDDTSVQNIRPVQNGCLGSQRNFTTPCALVDVVQGNDPCTALDAHPDDTCFNTFVDDNFSGNHKPCASDADCDAGDTCDVAGAGSLQPDVCTFGEIGNRINSANMLPDSNPNPGTCNQFVGYFKGNAIDLSPGGTGRSTGCGIPNWYNEGGPRDQDVNPFFASGPESDPQAGCLIKASGSYIRRDDDCDGVDDQIPDLCPRISELNPTDDSNGDGIGDECQCGDATGDGAVSGLDIGATALCANGVVSCDFTQVDADGDLATTAQDIGGIVAVVNGNLPTSGLQCARN